VQTDALGNFSLQYNETDGDSIKAHIKPTQGHNEAFVRILYLPGRGDKSGITLDAIPALDDSVYIGLDTLNRFAMEANFGAMSFEGLKKANFDSLKEVITSRNTFWTSGDTLHPDEQQYIMNLLKTKMDTHFKKKPTYIVIPQDSTMTSFNKNDAINWFKQKNLSTPGAITCLDPDYDGIINYSVISLLNVKDIMGQDTIYNDKAILQEGLSGRVAPGEVGIISPIRSNQTILHKNTQCNSLMPADDWLIKIAEHYAPKTSYYVLLKTDNFERIKNYSVP
jgi:hypothetical protein